MSAALPSGGIPAGKYSRRSMAMLAFIPVSLIAGFVVGSVLLGDPNSPDSPQRWDAFARVVALWVMIEIPAALGMFWGRRAMNAGEASGRTGLIINAVVFALFTLTTLVAGTIDAFNGTG